jgi:hypothetical protein
MSQSAPHDSPPLAGLARTRTIPTAGASALLRRCRDAGIEALQRLLAHTLDQLDDALFELSSKAQSDAQQRVHFDSMRDVRLRRAGIETGFRARLLDRFEHRPATAVGPKERTAAEPGGTTLGLVDNDELEVSLAVKNMVDKAQTQCEDEIYGLDRRLGHLMGEPDLEGTRNPLGPESLCTCFRQACDGVETTLTVRLLLLKLFDRHVIGELEALYRGLNQQLVAQGVLAGLQRPLQGRPLVRPGRASASPARPSGLTPRGAAALEPEVVNLLQELSAATRPGQVLADSALADAPPGAVVTALTRLQNGQPATGSVIGFFEPGRLAVGSVNVLRELRETGLGRHLGQVDDLMLEVVTLLFDYVLDDKNIPAALKALIGRLQIPLLKVALLDKALFVRKTHPARRLLNALAEAALGWDEARDGNDELFRAVERVVQRVLTEFDQNVEIFIELLAEFEGFVTGQEQRAQQRAELSAKILQGRERLEQAKSAADDEVRRALATAGVPAVVREFIDRHWRNLLVVTHNREGDATDLWRSRTQILEMLVWSVVPKRSEAERGELLATLPAFVRGLNETIRSVGIPDAERERFLAYLAQCQAAALRGETIDPEPAGEPRPFPDALGPAPEVEEIVIEGGSQGPAESEHAGAEPMDDEHTATARDLPMGTWVEFARESGTRARARLTWVSSVTGVYLFTDRKGMKVAERTPAGLAAEFRRGTARLMEAVPLFDRAVSHLMRGLRRPRAPQR